MTRRGPALRLVAVAIAMAVTAGACSGSGSGGESVDETGDDVPRLVAQSPTAPPTSTADGPAEGTADPSLDPDAEQVLEGRVTNPYDLDVGQCFNEYVLDRTDGGSEDITTVVDCRGVHDGEVFHQFVVAGAQGSPFPGDTALDELAEAECYARFAEFVGVPYELSELGLGYLRPTVETWTGAGVHREITCYVEPYDSTLRLEGGSVAGRGL